MTVVINGTSGITSVNGSAAAPSVTGTDTDTGIVYGTNTLSLATGGTTAVTLDSSQNVGVGTGSPLARLDVAKTSNDTISRANASIAAGDFASLGAGLMAQQKISTPYGFALQAGNAANSLQFPLLLNPSGGSVCVNNSTGSLSGTGPGQLVVACSTASTFALALTNTNASGAYGLGVNSQTGENIYLYYQGAYKGLVSTSAGGTTYGTTSDYRLKENVQPMVGALAKVSQLKPCTYTWKEDGSDGQGFIAHELAEVCQQAVVGEKDAIETYTDEDGNEQTRPKYQSIDTSFLVATLTAAIQEQQAIIEQLRADVETLKSA